MLGVLRSLRFTVGLSALVAVSSWSGQSLGQGTFPERPVTIVVPFDAGGTPDQIARQLASRLQQSTGQSFIVENRVGAGGSIAARYVAQAKPDGYTLIMGTISTHAVNTAVLPNLQYHPVTDFEAVAQVGSSPQALVVPAASPASSLKEFIAYAKTKQLSYGSSGVGSSNHLIGALFLKMNNIEAVHVPYKGGPPAVQDLLAGRIDFMFYAPIALIQHQKAGSIKTLAMGGSKRSESMPDVPTAEELGMKNFDVSGFAGMFAPAKTPRPVVDRLHAEIGKAILDPDFRKWMVSNGLDMADGVSVDAFAQLVKFEVNRWSEIAKVAGAKAN
jgi:tripartite-type tricarboxylate transporter receptor subunit TctC